MQRKSHPLYRYVYQDLYEKIGNGYYPPGELIPTEKELQEIYQVSRVTIRKACDLLVKEHLLQRTPGYGSIVQTRFMTQKPTDQKGFSEEMRSSGKRASTRVLDFCVMPANAQIASILGIQENDLVYHYHRARYGDDELLQLEETYMSVELFPDLSIQHLENSKFQYVESKGFAIDIAFHQTMPVLPNEQIAKLFNITTDTPIIKINNTTFLTNGKIMDYTEQYMNSPKYQLRYIRKREGKHGA